MLISPIKSNMSNDRNSNKITFCSAKDLNATKEIMTNFLNEPETAKILKSGNRSKIGEKLLELKQSLINKILDLNPGSRISKVAKEDSLIYDKNGEYIGAFSQIPSGEYPMSVDYYDNAMKEFAQIDIMPRGFLGKSSPRYVNRSAE